MNLKEYIKAAITDITSAISELQAELDNGANVRKHFCNKQIFVVLNFSKRTRIQHYEQQVYASCVQRTITHLQSNKCEKLYGPNGITERG